MGRFARDRGDLGWLPAGWTAGRDEGSIIVWEASSFGKHHRLQKGIKCPILSNSRYSRCPCGGGGSDGGYVERQSTNQTLYRREFCQQKRRRGVVFRGLVAGPLPDSGLIDSTGIFHLVAFLEKEFNINIPDEDIVPEHYPTIESLAALVGRRRQG